MKFFSKDKASDEQVKPKKSQLRDWSEALIVAAILALIIRTFVVQAFKIPSGSMEDTLLIGDHLLVSKFIYGLQVPFSEEPILSIRDPERGDIIVFEFPEDISCSFFRQAAQSARKLFEQFSGQLVSPECVRSYFLDYLWKNEQRMDSDGIVEKCRTAQSLNIQFRDIAEFKRIESALTYAIFNSPSCDQSIVSELD